MKERLVHERSRAGNKQEENRLGSQGRYVGHRPPAPQSAGLGDRTRLLFPSGERVQYQPERH